jgi:two-component system, OmpR family, KDP operon response regulator KdpE
VKPGPRALIVDDDPAMRRFLRDALKEQAYSVFEAASADGALRAASAIRPDVIILDADLPDGVGVEVIRKLREFVNRPIIVVTADTREAPMIAALDAGADDYLTRPFGIGELLARLRVMLRHVAGIEKGEPFRTGDLTVDLRNRRVTIGDAVVQLTPTEYDLLKALVTATGKILTYQQLIRQVWGHGTPTDVHMLQVNVSNLRHKLPTYILTESRIGYRLRVDG